MSAPETPDRYVRASVEFLDQLGTRTHDGYRISAEWGPAVGHEPDGDLKVYEPRFTVHRDDSLRATVLAEAIRRVEGLTPFPDDGPWLIDRTSVLKLLRDLADA